MKVFVSTLLLICFATVISAGVPGPEADLPDLTRLTPTVFDARAHSLGRCEILGATGSNSIFYNPAHISGLDKTQLQVGGTTWFGDYNNSYWDSDEYSDYEHSQSYKMLPVFSQFSFIHPLGKIKDNMKMSLGLGLNKHYDLTSKMEKSSTGFVNNSETDLTLTVKGGLYFVTPSVAFEFYDKLKVGITYNQSVLSERNYLVEETTKSDFGKEEYIEKCDQSLNASFITLGALYPVTERVTLGFIYKSKLEIEFDSTDIIYTWIDDDGLPSEYSEPLSKYDITLPSTIGFGASFDLTSEITLYGEYQTRNWTELKTQYEYFSFDDGISIRGGMDAKFDNKSIRLGFFNDSLPIKDFDSSANATPLNNTGVTYGFGIDKGKLLFEIGGEYSWLKQETVVATIGQPLGLKYENTKTIYGFYATISYFLE
jgi:long-subunit fatty acid transport protein